MCGFVPAACVCRCLDKAAIVASVSETPRQSKVSISKGAAASASAPAAAAAVVSVSEVEETKAFLGIMPLFLCICV